MPGSRRIPAPPPGGGPPRPRGGDRNPPRDEGPFRRDEDDEPSSVEDLSEADEEPLLLRPDAWPDDEDEPTIPDGLLDGGLEDLPPLDGPADDAGEDDVLLPDPDEVPLEDDLADLDAPDDTDVPVIPWTVEVTIDGRRAPARADPGREQTVWLRPSAAEGERDVQLLVAGKRLQVRVRLAPADQEAVLLGRDVLSGRFLLRP